MLQTRTLTAIAATMLVVANIVAVKIVSVSVPIAGSITFSAGVFPIAVVFFCTDVISEREGKDVAKQAVWEMVFILIVSYVVIQLSVMMPHGGGVSQTDYALVLDASLTLLVASIVTALFSQTLDVIIFHRIRRWTDGSVRWTRNVGSTTISQFIDTAVFTMLAFFFLPPVTGGTVLPISVIVSIIVVEYVVKLCIALVDTIPFYIVTESPATNSNKKNNV